MRLISANVNGVRAALRRGGLHWLAGQDADVIALQEVRADSDVLAKALAEAGLGGWEVHHAPGVSAGRAGVAVLARHPVAAVRAGVGVEEFADSGRWVEVDLEVHGAALTVISAYVHTGEADTPKQDEKYRFLDAMSARMAQLAAAGGSVAITGDFNVARSQADIKNWRGNLNRAGFLPRERDYIEQWVAEGWADLGRDHGGPGPGPYTWWSWRGRAFDNDAGWRIDYVLATPRLARLSHRVAVVRADSYEQRWSDHSPVVVDFAGPLPSGADHDPAVGSGGSVP